MLCKKTFILLFVGFLGYSQTFATKFHVRTTGSDASNGITWDASFSTLQKALNSASFGDRIWVAKGIYYPDEGAGFLDNDSTISFIMKNGVAIYGGFLYTGTPDMTDRNWTIYPTILSGDIDKDNTTNHVKT